MNWDAVVQKVTPHIVAIDTPAGRGTGFLCLYNDARNWCGIATAAHVIADVERWQQPIRIRHHQTNNEVLLKEGERIIIIDAQTDSAVVLVPPTLGFPQDPIGLLPLDRPLPIGVEVGWLGFPSIDPMELCFFAGNISARKESRRAYLIDGVAINGVSGGPVVFADSANGTHIVGVVSAYYPNRVTGEVRPGLALAQDVSQFHGIAAHIRSVDEANRKKREIEAAAPPPAAGIPGLPDFDPA